MIWSNLEYVSLRLIRRFFFQGAALDRWAWALPYFQANQALLDPAPIIAAYQDLAAMAGLDLAGKRAVELGCGATNATGYAWVASLGGQWTGVEPFAQLDEDLDRRARAKYPKPGPEQIRRVKNLADLPDGLAQVIVSNSVLEHVQDLDTLLSHCRRVLAPGGFMLHQVDYRDHFFKYPFHFLQFSQAVWDKWLNPGDLPRWRLDDHLSALKRAGFAPQVQKSTIDQAGLKRVAPFLNRRFASQDRAMLAVTKACILARVAP